MHPIQCLGDLRVWIRGEFANISKGNIPHRRAFIPHGKDFLCSFTRFFFGVAERLNEGSYHVA
jgi:hypothetical protein